MGRSKEELRRTREELRQKALGAGSNAGELGAAFVELYNLAGEAIDQLPDDRASDPKSPPLTTGQPPDPPTRM
jgi:hypothetical protein